MAKTNPIGVRFDEDLLKVVKEKWGDEVTAQRALRLYEDTYRKFKEGILVLKPVSLKIVSTTEKSFDGKKTNPYLIDEVGQMPPLTSDDIEKQIAAIKAEKIPENRNTIYGRKTWELDQSKRIDELKKLLK